MDPFKSYGNYSLATLRFIKILDFSQQHLYRNFHPPLVLWTSPVISCLPSLLPIFPMEGLTSVYLTTQVACLKECTSLNAVKPGTSELKAYKETFQLSRDTILTAQPLAVKTQAPGDPHRLVPGAGCSVGCWGQWVVHVSTAERGQASCRDLTELEPWREINMKIVRTTNSLASRRQESLSAHSTPYWELRQEMDCHPASASSWPTTSPGWLSSSDSLAWSTVTS